MSIPSAPQTPTCYRHPDRVTQVRCTRCNRPACAECLRSAAVGHQCVDCVHAGAKTVRRPSPPFGGQSGSTTPLISYTLIALNVLTFGAQQLSPGLDRDMVLWSPAVADGQFYRLVTSAFLHYGLLHLLFNMWALYVVGPALEAALGRLRFGALYALSALGGSVLVYLVAPLNTATAGASGAVFGLFAATFVVGRRLRVDVGWVAALIVINLVFTFTIPHISWQGHVGGLLAGALVALAYTHMPGQTSGKHRNQMQAAVTVALLLVFAALVWWRSAELAAQLGLS